MLLDWIDVSSLSFNCLTLMERAQIRWFPGWLPEPELAIALRANPVVEWYLRNRCPEVSSWLDRVMAQPLTAESEPVSVRATELAVLNRIQDLLVYALDPAIYDAQPFLGWDSNELTRLVDFTGKVVIDIGAGTGRLTWVAAPCAAVVYAVEPVGNLRHYLRAHARQLGFTNVYPQDGLITALPFPAAFAEVTMCGHVFGDQPSEEYAEMARVTRPGGMVILCPGTNLNENDAHTFLVSQRFEWSCFEEPHNGVKRKYWKTLPLPMGNPI
jgi:SAM-dependent methyltransferase